MSKLKKKVCEIKVDVTQQRYKFIQSQLPIDCRLKNFTSTLFSLTFVSPKLHKLKFDTTSGEIIGLQKLHDIYFPSTTSFNVRDFTECIECFVHIKELKTDEKKWWSFPTVIPHSYRGPIKWIPAPLPVSQVPNLMDQGIEMNQNVKQSNRSVKMSNSQNTIPISSLEKNKNDHQSMEMKHMDDKDIIVSIIGKLTTNRYDIVVLDHVRKLLQFEDDKSKDQDEKKDRSSKDLIEFESSVDGMETDEEKKEIVQEPFLECGVPLQ